MSLSLGSGSLSFEEAGFMPDEVPTGRPGILTVVNREGRVEPICSAYSRRKAGCDAVKRTSPGPAHRS